MVSTDVGMHSIKHCLASPPKWFGRPRLEVTQFGVVSAELSELQRWRASRGSRLLAKIRNVSQPSACNLSSWGKAGGMSAPTTRLETLLAFRRSRDGGRRWRPMSTAYHRRC